ncbi:hypothetical protein JHK87_050000 [Glycine soja]|nr:hypothetical protein JHK87_050000 [Glycine soja]
MTKRQKSNSSSTIITPSSSSMIDQEAYRIALVKLFMALELSFRMVEHEAFQEFVRIIAPSFVVISHTTLAWDILSLWSSEKLIVESFDGEGGELTCKLRDKVESSLRSLFEKYNYGGDEFEVSSLEARARPSERVKNDPYGYSRYFQSTRSIHVEEHKNQLHLLLRVEKFSPSQIDAISGVLLLISCPLEWGAPTFDAGHAFGMVVAISLIS